MYLFNFIAKGISRNLLSKQIPIIRQVAQCGTTNKQVTDDQSPRNELVDCDDDAPVHDMQNPYQRERRLCILCRLNITPDFKNPKLLSQFVSMYTGKTYGRHITGLCKKRQEQVDFEIRRSQRAGFMPYYLKDPAFMQDPELFNPDTPFRNHPY